MDLDPKQLVEKGYDRIAQIALAKQYVPGATFLQKDMMVLEFPPATFDAVIAFYSIIHLPRSEQAVLLQHIAGWLSPGGWFLVNLGISDNPGMTDPDWLGALMYWSSYDAQTNLEMVKQAGLIVVESDILNGTEDGEPVSFLWILAQKGWAGDQKDTQ